MLAPHTLPLTPSLPCREWEDIRRRRIACYERSRMRVSVRLAAVHCLFFLLFFFPSFLYSQDSLPLKIEFLIEQLGEQNADEETDYSQLTELLKQYLSQPLNINKANTTELEELQVLNPLQISSLQAHIRKNGKLLSVYE